TGDRGAHAAGDGLAGGVVGGRVDAQARGQAFHRELQCALRAGQVLLIDESGAIGVDDCHDTLLMWVLGVNTALRLPSRLVPTADRRTGRRVANLREVFSAAAEISLGPCVRFGRKAAGGPVAWRGVYARAGGALRKPRTGLWERFQPRRRRGHTR